MRLYTPTVNSEWLPEYKLDISCSGVLQQKLNTVLMTSGFALGQSALYFCCSTPGQYITNTYIHVNVCMYVCTGFILIKKGAKYSDAMEEGGQMCMYITYYVES